MKSWAGIILFALGIVLVFAFTMTASGLSRDLRDIFLLFPGLLFMMAGPVVAYALRADKAGQQG